MQFRGLQKSVIQAILQGQSPILAVMSTGSGKSLLFQLPASIDKGVTVVVVPLIALCEDLIDRCSALNISCVKWVNQMGNKCPHKSLIFVTPEAALGPQFASFLNQLRALGKLDRIVIDEAHVILNDQWELRKEMQQLGE